MHGKCYPSRNASRPVQASQVSPRHLPRVPFSFSAHPRYICPDVVVGQGDSHARHLIPTVESSRLSNCVMECVGLEMVGINSRDSPCCPRDVQAVYLGPLRAAACRPEPISPRYRIERCTGALWHRCIRSQAPTDMSAWFLHGEVCVAKTRVGIQAPRESFK